LGEPPREARRRAVRSSAVFFRAFRATKKTARPLPSLSRAPSARLVAQKKQNKKAAISSRFGGFLHFINKALALKLACYILLIQIYNGF
jgi:hypothetical protein